MVTEGPERIPQISSFVVRYGCSKPGQQQMGFVQYSMDHNQREREREERRQSDTRRTLFALTWTQKCLCKLFIQLSHTLLVGYTLLILDIQLNFCV